MYMNASLALQIYIIILIFRLQITVFEQIEELHKFTF